MRLTHLRATAEHRFRLGLCAATVAMAGTFVCVVYILGNALSAGALGVSDPATLFVLVQRAAGGERDHFRVGQLGQLDLPFDSIATVGSDLARAALLQDSRPRLRWGREGRAVRATAATAGYFETLGVGVRGRSFQRSDDRLGAPPVVILAHDTWRARFGGNVAAIGQQVDLGALVATVVGVAGEGFRGPRIGDRFELWLSFGGLPVATGMPEDLVQLVSATTYVRLRDASNAHNAELELLRRIDGVSADGLLLRELSAILYPPTAIRDSADDQRLLALLAAIALAMVAMSVINLSALEIARGDKRRAELALREVLGATRTRLAMRMLGEAATIASVGAALAIMVAQALLQALSGFALPTGVAIGDLRLDVGATAMMVTLVTSLAVAGVAALVPIRHLSSRGPSIGRRLQGGFRFVTFRSRAVFLTLHVALCTLLVVLAVLFARTVQRSVSFDYGFDIAHTGTVTVQPSLRQFVGVAGSNAVRDRASTVSAFLDAIRGLPGVRAVSIGSLPLGPAAKGDTDAAQLSGPATVRRFLVGPGFAHAAGLQLIAGSDLTLPDATAPITGVLVSESFASSRWSPAQAIGQVFDVTVTKLIERRPREVLEPRRVVGVVRDALRQGIHGRLQPAVFEIASVDDAAARGVAFSVVLSAEQPSVVTRDLEALAAQYFPSAAQVSILPAADLVATEVRTQRLGRALFVGLSIGAVLIALIGVAGFAATLVAARRREIGVRLALGAQQQQVIGLIRRAALVPVAIGCAVGMACFALGSPLVRSYVFGLSRVDLLAPLGAAAALLAVGWVGTYSAARRASRIDPAAALRSE